MFLLTSVNLRFSREYDKNKASRISYLCEKHSHMPQLITYGNELIRINPAKNSIEYSTNRGASWMTRYSGSSCGTFRDLLPYDGIILACTDKGIYYTTNKGASWMCRNSGSSTREFVVLQDAGRELLAQSSDGHLYYSTNAGASWMRRH